jgi:hypothetical protein
MSHKILFFIFVFGVLAFIVSLERYIYLAAAPCHARGGALIEEALGGLVCVQVLR